ncbi:replication-relaxation family protein [Streptomyces sp. NPDC014986]|uniref:replication-relaxation family protein n=1 Tax=Streptomyces sp. NPDC014986 TaxID=3364934 RepID=UPI0036FA8745
MTDVDTGSRDRLALAVLAQYRMTTTEQMHLIISPNVRIEQTRRQLAKLRAEGLVNRITLPQAGRTRVWFPASGNIGTAVGAENDHGRLAHRLEAPPSFSERSSEGLWGWLPSGCAGGVSD